MKRLMIVAAATLAFATTASAQTQERLPAIGSGTQVYGPAGQGFPGVAEGKYDRAPTPKAAPVNAAVPAPPEGWSGTATDWEVHARACAARYRTYDPATDMFYARPGVKARCTH